LKKLDRVFAFPTLGFFSDLILFITSVITIEWVRNNVNYGLHLIDEADDPDSFFFRKLANFQVIVEYKFEYLLAIMISCLILKVLDLI